MGSCWQPVPTTMAQNSACGIGERHVVLDAAASEPVVDLCCCIAGVVVCLMSAQTYLCGSTALSHVAYGSRFCEPLLTRITCLCTQGFKLAAAKLHAPVSQISFHPADNSCLLTTASEAPDHASTAAAGAGEAACSKAAPSAVDAAASQSGSLLLWQLHRLWDRHELQSTALQTASGCKPTCHAWAPEVGAAACCGAVAMASAWPLMLEWFNGMPACCHYACSSSALLRCPCIVLAVPLKGLAVLIAL